VMDCEKYKAKIARSKLEFECIESEKLVTMGRIQIQSKG
jgi:hypothetical protein